MGMPPLRMPVSRAMGERTGSQRHSTRNTRRLTGLRRRDLVQTGPGANGDLLRRNGSGQGARRGECQTLARTQPPPTTAIMASRSKVVAPITTVSRTLSFMISPPIDVPVRRGNVILCRKHAARRWPFLDWCSSRPPAACYGAATSNAPANLPSLAFRFSG